MKYLKIEKAFFEISDSDYELLLYGQELGPVDGSYTDIGENFLQSEFDSISRFKLHDVSLDMNSIIIHSNIFVSKLSDEWFLVEYGLKYYKCDQIDGLVDCLKSIQQYNLSQNF